MKYVLRIIVLPFFSAIALVAALKQWLEYSIQFVMFGGEAIAYSKKHRSITMGDVMNFLQDTLDSDNHKQNS